MCENDSIASKVGVGKAMKEAVEAYDAGAGHYENEAGIKKATSLRPSKDTKSPLGGLHGGK
jgi:hypothetical protein